MNIRDAQQLVLGARVKCPSDRGDAPHSGTVEHIGTEIGTSISGTQYIWISVRRPHGHVSVWPSNRLG